MHDSKMKYGFANSEKLVQEESQGWNSPHVHTVFGKKQEPQIRP